MQGNDEFKKDINFICLTLFFDTFFLRDPLETVIASYKKKIRSLVVDYVVKPEQKEIKELLRRFIDSYQLPKEQITSEDETLLREMVRQNILYFDPTKATYYPQGTSYHHGIRLHFRK